jgi:glutaminyl-peptide cyclotransferase
MQKRVLISIIALALIIFAGAIGVIALNFLRPNAPTFPLNYTYRVIDTYPHDPNAFTQGLVFDNGNFFESTGYYGNSSLRKVDPNNGRVLKKYSLPNEFFGEGLTIVGNSLIQLTWREQIGFVYDKDTFTIERNFSYSNEGWGLTFDGNRLIMSDGSSNLYFLDPTTFKEIGQIKVHDGNKTLKNINELEFVNGDIYANIWMQNTIVIINPGTGQVKGYIDLSGLYHPTSAEAVLNGIAYDKQADRLFVTGKNWPSIYHIKIIR